MGMMDLMTPEARDHFDRIVTTIARRGQGVELSALSTARALAVELDSAAQDGDRVQELADRIDVPVMHDYLAGRWILDEDGMAENGRAG